MCLRVPVPTHIIPCVHGGALVDEKAAHGGSFGHVQGCNVTLLRMHVGEEGVGRYVY